MKHSALILLVSVSVAMFISAPAPAQTVSFDEFLQQFPTATLPYEISEDGLQAEINGDVAAQAQRLDWAYFEFLPELENSAQYSRMPVYPEPVARFETDKYHAVLYNLARGLSKDSKYYTISVFDKEGTHLGTHYIAGYTKETLTTVVIDEQLLATVKGYKLKWPAVEGAKGVQPVKTEIGTDVLELTAPGNPNDLKITSVDHNGLGSTTASSAMNNMR